MPPRQRDRRQRLLLLPPLLNIAMLSLLLVTGGRGATAARCWARRRQVRDRSIDLPCTSSYSVID